MLPLARLVAGVSLVVSFFFCSTAMAATFYVSKTGNDSTGDGSQSKPWLTMNKANSGRVGGDVIRVEPGTYSEQITLANSGISGSPITWLADGNGVICRGFWCSKSYIRIIGFEITHSGTTFSNAIAMAGSADCSHIELIDLYIHDTYSTSAAIRVAGGGTHSASYITIRGCRIYYPGSDGGTTNVVAGGVYAGSPSDSHWLVEYNTIQRAGDFIDLWSDHCIARNNYLGDYNDSYDSDGSPTHVDFFQAGSDGTATGTQYHIYESNYMYDNVAGNSHVNQHRNTVANGDTHILIRGNVAHNVGSYALQCGAIPYVAVYDNTYVGVSTLATRTASAINWNAEGGNPSLNGYAFNNIFQDTATTGYSTLFSISGGSSVTKSNNVGHHTPTDSSLVSTADPLFVDLANGNFNIQLDSPAKGAGTNLSTVTSADGSGTSVNVSNSFLFIDGYGIAEGDLVQIGTQSIARITSISGDTLTLSRSVTWKSGDPVYWKAEAGSGQDIGAYPYRANGCALTSASISNSGNVYTVSLSDPVTARMVIFYENGIPQPAVFDPPFTYTSSGGTVTAKAYARFAGPLEVVTAVQSPGNPKDLDIK